MQYNELVAFGYPFVFSCKRPQVEVIYIDRDRLHLWSAAKTKKPTAEETPRVPMKRLRDEAEDLRQLQAEWERFWQTDRALQTRDGE